MLQVVSIHSALTPETYHLIGQRELEMMKPDAILINTARGPHVDEKALVRHLQKRPTFSAGKLIVLDAQLFNKGCCRANGAQKIHECG